MYNDPGIDYRLSWVAGVQEDMDALDEIEPAHADLLDALFEQLENDRGFRECLSENRYQRLNPRLETAPIEWAKEHGLNINYLKLWDDDGALVSRRVIYAVDHSPNNRRLVILGLMPRDVDYDFDSSFGQRILNDYERRNVPRVAGWHHNH